MEEKEVKNKVGERSRACQGEMTKLLITAMFVKNKKQKTTLLLAVNMVKCLSL